MMTKVLVKKAGSRNFAELEATHDCFQSTSTSARDEQCIPDVFADCRDGSGIVKCKSPREVNDDAPKVLPPLEKEQAYLVGDQPFHACKRRT